MDKRNRSMLNPHIGSIVWSDALIASAFCFILTHTCYEQETGLYATFLSKQAVNMPAGRTIQSTAQTVMLTGSTRIVFPGFLPHK